MLFYRRLYSNQTVSVLQMKFFKGFATVLSQRGFGIIVPRYFSVSLKVLPQGNLQ